MSNSLLNLINEVHLENLGIITAPTVYIYEKEYQILTLKFGLLTTEGIEDNSTSYLLSQNNEIHRVKDSFSLIAIADNEEFLEELNQKLLYLSVLLKHLAIEIDEIEDDLFDRKDNRHFIENWFESKKELLKLERIFNRISEVFAEFDKKNPQFFENISTEFLDFKEELEITKRITKSQLTKLDTLYNYYTSINNDHLNRNIFMLALVSGIFLPLNLVVGFFGMNTGGMYFAHEANGTQTALILLVVLFFILILGLPIFRKIDNYFFNKLFATKRNEIKIEKRIQNIQTEISHLKK